MLLGLSEQWTIKKLANGGKSDTCVCRFWHNLYSKQQKLSKAGTSTIKQPRIAIDYDEKLAGTSLAHFVKNASQIYKHEGRLSYDHKNKRHEIGCLLHAQGQSGSLIQKDITRHILEIYPQLFAVRGHRVNTLNSVLKLF